MSPVPHVSEVHSDTLGGLPGATSSREEIAQLRAQLDKARSELQLITAERDHLRSQTARQHRQTRLSQGANRNGRPDLAGMLGQSRAQVVDDPRIDSPRKILVIGGGPAGLISLHELLNPINRPQGHSLDGYRIELYERRADVGGVWYFEPENDIAKGWHHGTTGCYDDTPRPAGGESGSSEGGSNEMHKPPDGHGPARHDSDINVDFCYRTRPQTAPRWPSPAYEGLVGNVLPPLLEFAAERFPTPAGGLFPSMTETHDYLLDLAAPLRSHIRTCREVVRVRPVFREGGAAAKWEVETIDWLQRGGGAATTEEWDAIITAAGAFDHPYWPDIPGLARLRAQRSPLVMHAKTYPGPRPFVNQHNKIVVVGNANSANDIAAHLAPLNSSGPLYRCGRHESKFAHLPDARIKDVPPIASMRQEGKTLSLTLTDGTPVEGVTKVIFASGYQFAFDWLSVPSVRHGERDVLVPSSVHGAVPNLHNATFHAAAPTLAFVGLGQGSTPMPLAEIQARTAARAFHGLLRLPPTREAMLASYGERAAVVGVSLDDPDRDVERWRALHMIRGPVERVLTQQLLDALEEGEEGASDGLFRWDEWREGVVKTMRAVKEGELRRLREARVAAGGVDGGVGSVLSYGAPPGQTCGAMEGEKQADAAKKTPVS